MGVLIVALSLAAIVGASVALIRSYDTRSRWDAQPLKGNRVRKAVLKSSHRNPFAKPKKNAVKRMKGDADRVPPKKRK